MHLIDVSNEMRNYLRYMRNLREQKVIPKISILHPVK